MGTMVAGASGSSFKNSIDSGLSGLKIGFATGAITGLQVGYKNYKTVQANTVSNPDNAIKSQAKPTNAFSDDSYDLSKDMPSNGLKNYHGNDLRSTKPTWGYKLYDNNDKFLKNGITNKVDPVKRYTKAFMSDKYMVPVKLFPVRIDAYKWEFQQNTIERGSLNLNMH